MISVIIPTYNRGYKISRTIDSVLGQTYQDIEVIVIDDASHDNTKEVLDSYHDERIRYHKLKRNGGCCKARNIGVRMAKGEYIAFLDSDDYWYPNKLERQLAFINGNPCDVTFCRYNGTEDGRKWLFPEDYVEQEIFTARDFVARNYASTQCILGKKEVFLDIGFREDLKTFQDWEMMLRVADKYLVKYQKEILVEYEIFSDSMSKNLKIIPPAMTKMMNDNKEIFDRYPDKKAEFIKFRQYFIDEVEKIEYFEKTPYGKYQQKQEKDLKGSYLFQYGKKGFIQKFKYRLLSAMPNGVVCRYLDRRIEEDLKKMAIEMGFFDEKWYQKQYGNPSFGFEHYISEGYLLGYNPNSNFSSALYIKDNRDVDFSRISPLEHFLKFGYKQKPYRYWNFSNSSEHVKIIEESEYFDEEYYLSQLPGNVPSPAVHYLDVGYINGLNPSKDFHNDAYLGTFYDLNFNPLLHYESYGRDEGRMVYDVDRIEGFNQELLKAGEGLETTRGKNILLISHELSMTGAPRAALNLAKRLKLLGFHVEVVSPSDGPMRKEFEENGFKVYVNIYLFGRKENEVFAAWKKYASKFDCIIFNSIVAATSAHCLKDIPVKKIHWIHEGTSTFEDGSEIFDYQNNTSCIDELYAVSEYSREVCSAYTDQPIGILSYGIDDVKVKGNGTHEKLRFMLAGSICTRKGHGVLLEALELLDKKVLKEIEVVIAGGCIEPELKQRLLDSQLPCLDIVGEVNHDKLLEMLADSDVLLCPSLDDPLPIVCAEALMLSKTVVVSDHSGTSSLIEDGKNGFVIKAGDPKSLAEAMKTCLKLSKEEHETIGLKGRKIYEEVFTMSSFDKQLLKVFGLVDTKE